MDRLNQLRGEAGGSRDSTLDTSSPPSEAFMTANESSSKYFSLSEVDSTFDISPIKDISLASASVDTEKTITESDQLLSNLSPIGKKSEFDTYKIGKQIEAANILSGGVAIFDDNDNSYDGDELVIDDNAEIEEKSNPELKVADSQYKGENVADATSVEAEAAPAKKPEVVLAIDGTIANAINIGNGLYLYRKEGQEELAAIQIMDDQTDDPHQPQIKHLKVRESDEGKLIVYEEIQIEVPKEVPIKEKVDKNASHVPIKDISKVMGDSSTNKIAERKIKTQNMDKPAAPVGKESELNKTTQSESKSEGKTKKMTFSQSRKSPVVSSFTPMAFHSTPNKEIPLTKTMVDQQLHPNRHSDNIKQTIKVHTDSVKQRSLEPPGKQAKDLYDDKDKPQLEKDLTLEKKNLVAHHDKNDVSKEISDEQMKNDDEKLEKLVIDETPDKINIQEISTPIPMPNKEDTLKEKSANLITGDVSNNLNTKLELKECVNSTEAAENIEELKATDINLKKSNDKSVLSEVSKTEVMEENDELVLNKEHGCDQQVEESEIKQPQLDKEFATRVTGDQNIDNKILDATNLQQHEKSTLKPIVQSNTETTKTDNINPNNLNVTCTIDTTTTKSFEDKDKNVMTVDIKAIEKEIAQEVNSDSMIDSKGNELENILYDQDVKRSNISNVDPEQNISESCKKENKSDIQSEINPSESPECNKPDIILAPHPTDNKEKQVYIDSKGVVSKRKKLNDEIMSEKLTPALKKEIGNIVAESSNKRALKIAASAPNIAANSSELIKNPSKLPICVKDKEKDIKNSDSQLVIKQQDIKQNPTQSKNEAADKKVLPKITANPDQKPINNNHAAVPFGKWTDVNRQAFLNKIKESKVPTNNSNGKQIKNSNDLNRRDVLKKIDSQRQAQELANVSKLGVKKETAFASKTSVPQDNKPTVKTEIPILKNNSVPAKKTKQEPAAKNQTVTISSSTAALKKEATQRKEINNQDLIDKTIEGIINRAVKSPQEEVAQTVTKEPSNNPTNNDLPSQPQVENLNIQSLDDIEMKMNELHGIPFIERPAHELPSVQKAVTIASPKAEVPKAPTIKTTKIPNLLPFANKTQKSVKDDIIDVDSEEEVIEHEPITGDMDLTKKDIAKFNFSEKPLPETVTLISADSSKKETIITENDFDKFVRRNSINYEDCLTVSYDSKETHHNVVQTIVQKDSGLKTYSKADAQSNSKMSSRKHEQFTQNSILKPIAKFGNLISKDDCSKNYQSKVKMAYQTAMTAKHQLERPINIIEDRPVKVVYMDTNSEYISTQLNVQGQELSPTKKILPSNEPIPTLKSGSDTLDVFDESKVQDETKVKTKHQRKQVLTPVETPELELIAPDDLGIEVSPKKKRRTEEKIDKTIKTLVPKKSYLLGRGNAVEDHTTKPFEVSKNSQRETPKQEAPVVSHKNTASAIDSLVKAAELLETQSANMTTKLSDVPATPDSQQNTPVKRGRGRPRKYPLPEGAIDKTKVPSPQKKPRLIDAKVVKPKDSDDDDDSTDDEIVKENWTMGKINENIVCPICNKLFRSENVVFKHVKHCTGPSPTRSDSDKSPRRFRDSQESETKSIESKSDDMDVEEIESSSKKRKSKDTLSKAIGDKDDVIVIEDTPIKPKLEKRDETKAAEIRKTISKSKVDDKVSSLVCEFCGKTFRQLSYLVNHRVQHGRDDIKKHEDDSAKSTKTVFSCEVCKKDFRKLHHLVQHRIIHNPSNLTSKLSRKSSSEQGDNKTSKDLNLSKQSDDTSAGFRCEPCDKSFRKLHHLVEHRETHDGINRQKNTNTTAQTNSEKLPPPPQCDICKKTFRKLHYLIEHKEQHVETLSEKSDDKSIKSSLSTRDIIHECSLCYMVFPNEHSLNKHTIICQRKKRQSASKQQKKSEEDQSEANKEIIQPNENKSGKDDDVTIVMEEFPAKDNVEQEENIDGPVEEPKITETSSTIQNTINTIEHIQAVESPKFEDVTDKSESSKVAEIKESKPKEIDGLSNLPVKIKKPEGKESRSKVQDTPRKKTPLKDKVAPTVTKRHKPNLPLPVIDVVKSLESSDDDEIRYMLNPDYKFKDNEGKLFMKVRANKRNSLQIERPNSKDLVKRRISLQNPPKVPRLKAKLIQNKTVSNSTTNAKNITKIPKLEPPPFTDSDDSDVKYSFPEPSSEKAPKPSKNLPETSSSSKEPKAAQRKSLAEKRKSLSSIAKRKSVGRPAGAKHKAKASPKKQVRKRTAEVEHRCDCGQLFSSAALLSRHAVLAHTPPRIRRRRSPPPDLDHLAATTVIKPAPRKSVAAKTRPSAESRKSSVKSDVSNPNPKPNQSTTKRKSSLNKPEPKTPHENRKSPKPSAKTESVKSSTSNVKLRSYAAHKGVPVPEKMRKLMEKSKK